MRRARNRGAALIAALLTVALVATFAAAALWQQWRSIEVERAERTRLQAAWVLSGALDWARLILREDARSGGSSDHLAEPWAVPLQESRLSTFLAADKDNTMDTQAENAFLSGQIIDQHSMLNFSNLYDKGEIEPEGLRQFQRLFEVLGLPEAELNLMAQALRVSNDITAGNASAGQLPLAPKKVEQLAWLGLSVQTIAVLEPYVTYLPVRTAVNLNTAPAEVIYAVCLECSLADAQRLVAERERSPFKTTQEAGRLLPAPTPPATERFGPSAASVASRYFEVRGRLRLDQLVVEERSLVVRDGEVKTLTRQRGVIDPTALSRAARGQR